QIIDTFKATIKGTLDFGQGVDFSKVTFDAFSPTDSASFIDGLATNFDPNDPDSIKNGANFGKLDDVLKQNLTDLQVFKVGPKDDSTGKLGEDQGAYQLFVVGKTSDGKLAGVTFEAVET
ncbi:MAG TPA: nuclease A inhibitor family protein, partial [Myxococcota bacterium]